MKDDQRNTGDSTEGGAGRAPSSERTPARPRQDGTIAMIAPSSAGPASERASMPLDSYHPGPPEMEAGSISPSVLARRQGRIVPSSATVASLLEQVKKPPAARLALEARVASGGMGTIDIAVDRALDRRIAIKTLHPYLRTDEATVRMFLREARLTGLLDHPHIVPVYDLGQREDGQLFFAMKLVEGQTLAEMIRALPRGVLDTATLYMLLDVVAKVCDALAFAHSRGVIHCDVKPANVMVGEFGQVFLMDWGIARLIAPSGGAAPDSGREPTNTPAKGGATFDESSTDNSVIGTPSYMSPEQARGDRRRLDVRSDVFLLGATLYEVLTRRPPHAGADRVETLARAVAGDFPSPREVAGEAAVPLELERIVMRATAKDPKDRYPSVAALKDDLVKFMRGGAEFPRRSYAAGEAIVREGEPGDAAYILVEGSCEVRKETPNGPRALKTYRPGDVFGEMAILTEGPRTATVVALEPTTVLVVTSHVLEQELAALKPWMARLLKSLASRFREIDTRERVTGPAAPSPRHLANQVLMHAMTWGEDDGHGGRSLRFRDFAAEIEQQLGIPPVALFGVVGRYGLVLDVEADRLTVPDPGALRERLAAER
jgi:serine/threonine-protein kinase